MKNILLIAIVLFPILTLAQTGGIRSLKTKSAKIIHSDITGDNDVLIRIDSNGVEHKAFIDNATLYFDGDTLKSITETQNTTVQTLYGTTPTWDVSLGCNAKITLTGNTTIVLTNFVGGQSGSLTVSNAATQYSLNITQSGYVNAISKSIGTVANYTKLNTTGASAVDKYSWYYDEYYMFWRGETDFIKP